MYKFISDKDDTTLDNNKETTPINRKTVKIIKSKIFTKTLPIQEEIEGDSPKIYKHVSTPFQKNQSRTQGLTKKLSSNKISEKATYITLPLIPNKENFFGSTHHSNRALNTFYNSHNFGQYNINSSPSKLIYINNNLNSEYYPSSIKNKNHNNNNNSINLSKNSMTNLDFYKTTRINTDNKFNIYKKINSNLLNNYESSGQELFKFKNIMNKMQQDKSLSVREFRNSNKILKF